MVSAPAPRFFREQDEQPLLALLTAAFESWPGVDVDVPPIDHLRWKLSSHGLAQSSHIVVVAEGRLVGSRLSWAQPVQVRDRIVLARQGVDVCVHPAYRSRGLLREMYAFGADELRKRFEVDLALAFPSSLNTISDEPQRLGDPIEVLTHHFAPNESPSIAGPTAFATREIDRFDERTDAFFAAASAPFDFMIAHTKDYLNWRYFDPRAGAFTVLLAEEAEDVVGYSVLRVSRGKGYIADLLALPDRPDVVDELVTDALTRLRAAGVRRVEQWTPAHHPYRPVLERRGFAYARSKAHLRARPLGMPQRELDFLFEPGVALHLTAGDCDGI